MRGRGARHQVDVLGEFAFTPAFSLPIRLFVEYAATDLYQLQRQHAIRQFPVTWMRGELRQMLGTTPDAMKQDGWYAETDAWRFAEAALPVLGRLADGLVEHQRHELLMGFPSAPFIVPFATNDVRSFLAYATERSRHEIRLRWTGQGIAAEWTVSPAGRALLGSGVNHEDGYQLTFKLLDHLESWISEYEEHRSSQTRAVNSQFLSEIIIYRMVGDDLQTFQLRYQPGELRRRAAASG